MTPAPDHHRHLVIVGGDTISDNDGWLHETQSMDDDPDDTQAPRPRTKTEAKRLADLEARKSQGGRTDYGRQLKCGIPSGYRVVPNNKLSQKAKLGRAGSLNAAAERRSGCTRGVTIQYDKRAWSKRGVTGREAFEAQKATIALAIVPIIARAETQLSGDEETLDHLSYLCRTGTAKQPESSPGGRQGESYGTNSAEPNWHVQSGIIERRVFEY